MPKRSRVIQARRHARELAVQLLYSLEIRPDQDFSKCVDAFTKFGAASDADLNEDTRKYMIFLAEEVWLARSGIDDIMRRIVTGWRLERMVAVDRAVLRLAIFEGFIKKEVPVAVAISEAVELAQTFGTEDSGRFVNGVLSKVLRFMKGESKDGDKINSSRTDQNDESHAASITKDSTDS